MEALGDYIRELRRQRGLTQWDLSKISGLGRSHISRLEKNAYERPSAETFIALAKALHVKPEEMYKAAGYIREARVTYAPKDPEAVLKELGAMMPVQIPIMADVHAPQSEIIDYAYWAREKVARRNIIGLRIRGSCMEPDIQDGDVVFVDRERVPQPGDVLLCLCDDHVCLAKYTSEEDIAGKHIYGVVVECSRRMVKE